jgi:hypothetical protein
MENWISGNCLSELAVARCKAWTRLLGWQRLEHGLKGNWKCQVRDGLDWLLLAAKHKSPNREDLTCTSGKSPTDPLWPVRIRRKPEFTPGRWGVTWLATWLILPVVIRSSQRLSHACLSINTLLWNCERLIITVIIYLIVPYYLDNRSNSRANTCVNTLLG